LTLVKSIVDELTLDKFSVDELTVA